MRLLVVGMESRTDELSRLFANANLTIINCPGIIQALSHCSYKIPSYDWIILNRRFMACEELELLCMQDEGEKRIPVAFLGARKNNRPLLSLICSLQRTGRGIQLIVCELANPVSFVKCRKKTFSGEVIIEYQSPFSSKKKQSAMSVSKQ